MHVIYILIILEVLKIRLQRKGRKNRPFFRIVVAEKANAVQGRFLEIVGHYDPIKKDVVLKQDRIEYYLGNGAQPSQTLARLAVKNGMKSLEKYVKERFQQPKKEDKPAEES